MVKLSIIVPVYNVELYLSKCLDSIINQTFADFELILVNDGSTDTSRDICCNYLQKDSRVILLDKENGGLSSARNLGLAIAKGLYVAFVDSDDWIDLSMYDSMINALEDINADIVISGHKVVNIDNTIDEINTINESVLYKGEDATKLILKDEQIFSFAWDKIYKKALFNNVTYPNGRIYEDIATTYKLFHKAITVYHINKAFYYYVRREGSICQEKGKEVIRTQHNFLSFYERYLFVRDHPQYNAVFDKCEAIVIKLGINLMHYNARVPELFEKEYFIQLLNKLNKMKINENPLVSIKHKMEFRLLSKSEFLYRNFLKLFFYFK
jgi:glycosyltransferase involved in cell wall biosynthesis